MRGELVQLHLQMLKTTYCCKMTWSFQVAVAAFYR